MLRTYGKNSLGQWVTVQSDANDNDDMVWITTLIQCLKLTPGEDPFFAQYGIPAQESVVTQIFPDFWVAQIQSQFSQYFASLTVAKVQNSTTDNPATPTYKINILTHSGVAINQTIPT